MAKNLAVMALLVCITLQGCSVDSIPDEGTWKCEELNITIPFYGGKTTAVVDDEIISCITDYDRGGKYFTVYVREENHDKLAEGTILLEAEVKYLLETELCVIDKHTGREYTFVRIDSIYDS